MRDVLKTERLTLRPLEAADAPRLARFISDPGVARMLARVPSPYPPIAVEGWLMTLRARGRERDYVLGVELEGEGVIGVVGAHAGHIFADEMGAVEIGYWFARPYWGHGFATEAVSAFAREASVLGPLEAGHFADNPASGRVLEKSGFAYTGETKPLFCLARGENVPCLRMRHGESHVRWRKASECETIPPLQGRVSFQREAME